MKDEKSWTCLGTHRGTEVCLMLQAAGYSAYQKPNENLIRVKTGPDITVVQNIRSCVEYLHNCAANPNVAWSLHQEK